MIQKISKSLETLKNERLQLFLIYSVKYDLGKRWQGVCDRNTGSGQAWNVTPRENIPFSNAVKYFHFEKTVGRGCKKIGKNFFHFRKGGKMDIYSKYFSVIK